MIKRLAQVQPISPYDRVIKYFLPLFPRKLRPNHLTFFRLVMTPVLIVILAAEEYKIGVVFFAILAFTDLLDGALARLRNQVTDWGKVWDPVADKVLVGSVVAVLLLQINLNLTILLLAFELAFILGGTFQKMRIKDIEIMANTWGKIKMNLQCFGSGFLILGYLLAMPSLLFAAQLLLYLSLVFALTSLFTRGL